MSSEQNPNLDQTPESGTNPQHQIESQEKKQMISQKSVLHYLLVLFAAAFCLLILTLLMEQRTNDEIVDTLSDQILYAQSSHSEVITQRDQLAEELAAAQAEASQLEDALFDLQVAYNQDIQALQEALDAAEAQIVALEAALIPLEELES